MERWHESEVGNGKRQVGLLWGPAFRCCHPATVVLYIHFGEELGGTKALAQQRAELLSEAGGRRQSCWNLPHLPVVQERHRGAVALVPVISVAGLWFLTGVALLGLVDCPTQLNFYGVTIFAAGRDGK